MTIISVFTLSGPHICASRTCASRTRAPHCASRTRAPHCASRTRAPHCASRTRAPRATGFSLPVNSKKSEDSSDAF
ncbi:hypothetical protein ACFYXH_08320 [Streptomyces sp. NPDC002730]|uniref:hypothetical protein n=1 Tax=Streptomyces sp. NPDC002730 TaxID=3364662 RepID=UPI0036AE990A